MPVYKNVTDIPEHDRKLESTSGIAVYDTLSKDIVHINAQSAVDLTTIRRTVKYALIANIKEHESYKQDCRNIVFHPPVYGR